MCQYMRDQVRLAVENGIIDCSAATVFFQTGFTCHHLRERDHERILRGSRLGKEQHLWRLTRCRRNGCWLPVVGW